MEMAVAQIDTELLLDEFAKAQVQKVLEHGIELGAIAKIGTAVSPSTGNERPLARISSFMLAGIAFSTKA